MINNCRGVRGRGEGLKANGDEMKSEVHGYLSIGKQLQKHLVQRVLQQ